MQFHSTTLNGVWLVELQPVRDRRGQFARTFCVDAFREHGLHTAFVQHSASMTTQAGSIRGMHFQRAPHEEIKLLRCVTGAIHDVLIDIRPHSPTYMRWEAFRLDAASLRQLYVPAGVAHGFQTLLPDTEVDYLISTAYAPEAAAGIHFADPAFAIPWPLPLADISDKDQNWPRFVT
jgi:dTDP-4-dehydrorhamnose 3,5-epimerase